MSERELIIPSAPEIEELILGALITEPSAIEKLYSILTPEMFFVPINRKIYETMIDNDRAGIGFDMFSIAQELEKDLVSHGGALYIIDMTQKISSASRIKEHALIIREKFILRKMMTKFSKTIGMINSGEDTQEILAQTNLMLEEINQLVSGTNGTMQHVKEVLNKALEAASDRQAAYERGDRVAISTGLRGLDRKIIGFGGGEMILLAGRPGSGKSAIMLHLALKAAEQGVPVCIYSLEMSDISLANRFLISISGVNPDQFRRGALDREDWIRLERAAARIASLPIYIDANSMVSMAYIHSHSKAMKKKGRCGMVLIDYLQLADMATGKDNRNREQEVSQTSRQVKLMAKDLDIPVIVLSQLSRKVEERADKTPMLSDLRESGCITGDTLITVPSMNKFIPIKDLVGQTGFTVVAADVDYTNTPIVKPCEAVKCFYSGEKQVFELALTSGDKIKATANHKFYTQRGWIPLEDLSLEDKVAVPSKVHIGDTTNVSIDEVELVGHFIANGSAVSQQPIRFAYNLEDKDLAERVASCAKLATDNGVDYHLSEHRSAKTNFGTVLFRSTRKVTHGVRNPISTILSKYGLFDCRAKDKFIPEEFFFMSEDKVCRLLSALFTSDGTVSLSSGKKEKMNIAYSSSSEQLVSQIRRLLLRIGVFSTYSRIENAAGKVWYNISISGKSNLKAFVSKISFLSNRKQQKMLDAWKATEPKLAGWVRYEKNENESIVFSPIKAITKLGVESVYDIEVKDNHNFVANNILIHNSLEQDSDLVMFIYRPEYYDIRELDTAQYGLIDSRGVGVISVAKQREGATGSVLFKYNDSLSEIRDYES